MLSFGFFFMNSTLLLMRIEIGLEVRFYDALYKLELRIENMEAEEDARQCLWQLKWITKRVFKSVK